VITRVVVHQVAALEGSLLPPLMVTDPEIEQALEDGAGVCERVDKNNET
jgi:hypothetical protein